MSTALLARDPDLARLLDDGYDVTLVAGHVIVRIPYVTDNRTVEHGFLAHPITVAGDRLISGTDHRIWFGGSTPCDEHGRPLTLANPETRVIADGVQANFMLSSKPPDGYPDQYTKITAYVRIVADHAQAWTPRPRPPPVPRGRRSRTTAPSPTATPPPPAPASRPSTAASGASASPSSASAAAAAISSTRSPRPRSTRFSSSTATPSTTTTPSAPPAPPPSRPSAPDRPRPPTSPLSTPTCTAV